MQFFYVIFALCAIFSGFVGADSPIKTDKILKSNQAIVFDARTNTISYVLEITKGGKIIKKFLSNTEKQKILEQMNLGADSGKLKSTKPNLSESKIDKYPNSHIKEWDKSKIIYEQVVDKIQILR